MKRGSKPRREGQVWEETLFPSEDPSTEERVTHLFLVLALEPKRLYPSLDAYKLLDLETGELDWVAARRIDNPDRGWRRVG